jgi:hypothetical protein
MNRREFNKGLVLPAVAIFNFAEQATDEQVVKNCVKVPYNFNQAFGKHATWKCYKHTRSGESSWKAARNYLEKTKAVYGFVYLESIDDNENYLEIKTIEPINTKTDVVCNDWSVDKIIAWQKGFPI